MHTPLIFTPGFVHVMAFALLIGLLGTSCKTSPVQAPPSSSEPVIMQPSSYDVLIQADVPHRLADGHIITWGIEGYEESIPAPFEEDQAPSHASLHALSIEKEGMPTLMYRYASLMVSEATFFGEIFVEGRGFALTMRSEPTGRQDYLLLTVTPCDRPAITRDQALKMANEHPALRACLQAAPTSPTQSTGGWLGEHNPPLHQGLISLAYITESLEPMCHLRLGVYSGLHLLTP